MSDGPIHRPGKPVRSLAAAVYVAAVIAQLPEEEVDYLLEDDFWALRFIKDVVSEHPQAKPLCWYDPKRCMAA
jgi:hypothetical protein